MSTSRIRSAAAGALAAVSALAASELAAGAFSSIPSLVESVAAVFIDNVPAGLKQFAIDTFGTSDKAALVVGIAIVALILGGLVGIVAQHRQWLAVLVFGGFGAGGAAAAIAQGETTGGAVAGGGIATVAGLLALTFLYGRIEASDATVGGEADMSRRSFIVGAGAIVGLATLSVGVGRVLLDKAKRMVAGREDVVLPAAVETVAAPSATSSFNVPELSELITPNDSFYKIDTSLSTPRVDLSTWSLRIHGMVDRPYEMAFDELMEMDMVERYVTLSCVSNEVGGRLVGNAKWLGVPLGRILERAGVQDGADQVIGRSVDEFTVGFPTEAVFDGREALVAVGMNGEPLPFDHGFPARLVVAGLYGYVSATKWLSDIELTTWEGFDAYWVPRGWSKEGPIKTQSRIDTPRQRAVISPEPRAIAGVAWAPNRGISRVEVQVDDGDWIEAELAESLDDDAWRQWMIPWTPAVGDHAIAVRATDGTGETQTPDLARPAPNGASGWHTVFITVRA